MKGKFIVFEGIEGAGKSTQAKMLYEYIKEKGLKAVLTREPGGTTTGKKIRQILLEDNQDIFPPIAELFLYEADRSFHIHNVIKPSLEDGNFVICDRFILSTVAYQGFARGLSIDTIEMLNNLAVEQIYPDITFLIDIPVELSLERIGNNKDRIEKENVDFHIKLRNGFLKLAKKYDNIKVIDGTKNVDEVFSDILEILYQEGYIDKD